MTKHRIKKAANMPLERLIANPKNVRTEFDDLRREELITSLRTHGVQVPLIAYESPTGVVVVDGNRRLAAAPAAGLTELPVVVLDHEPSETELLLIQLTVNDEREQLNPIDRYEAYSALASLNNWGPSQLASQLGVSPARVSRVLCFGKLTPEVRDLMRRGKISESSGYALARADEEQRQPLIEQLLKGEINRDEVFSRTRKRNGNDTVKTARISCPVEGGTVTVQTADGLNISGLIDVLETLLKDCRKARTQGLDLSTAVRVFRDRARAQAESTPS